MKNTLVVLIISLFFSTACDNAHFDNSQAGKTSEPGKYQKPVGDQCDEYGPLNISWSSVEKAQQYNVKMGYTDKAFAKLTEYTASHNAHSLKKVKRGEVFYIELNAITLAKTFSSTKTALKLLTCAELRDLGHGDPYTHKLEWAL